MSYDLIFKNRFSRDWSRSATTAFPEGSIAAKVVAPKPVKTPSKSKKKTSVGLAEIMGLDEILGYAEIMGRDEIVSGRVPSEEELALAGEGLAEREALSRTGFNGYTKFMGVGAAPATDEVNFRFTEDEAKMLVTLAELKSKADTEDKEAKKKFATFGKRVAALKAKAGKGDQSAKRLLRVLEESGLFNQGQKITIDDANGECDEKFEIQRTISGIGNAISNQNYRATILKQAIKAAGGGRPTTKDFFKAKSAVDGVLGRDGASLFLPGAQPGRRTV